WYWPITIGTSISCCVSYRSARAAQVASVMQPSLCSSSVARSSTASKSLQPGSSGPALIWLISSCVMPAASPIRTCWPHSCTHWHSQPVRRIISSRSRAGSLPFSSLPPNGDHFRNRPGWRTRVAKMFILAPPSTVPRSSSICSLPSLGSYGGMRGDVGRGADMGANHRPGGGRVSRRRKSGNNGCMPRPIWSGAISFGLVSIPVKIYNSVQRKNVSFNQLDSRDNQRIRYRKVNAESGEEVPDDLIVKGYEVTKGHYVVVDPDELEQFMPTVTRSIDLDEFVNLTDIDPLFYDSPYYLAPDKVVKPYALLARAMEDAGKVGIGRFVMRNKEYVAAVRPIDGRLVLSTLVHADEVVDPKVIGDLDGVDTVEVSDKELKMAEQLVESLAGPFELERYPDTY